MGPPPLPCAVGTDGVGRLPDGRRVYFDETVAPFGSMAERALAQRERAVRVRRRPRRRHRRGARQHRAGRLARASTWRSGLRAGRHRARARAAARSARSRCRSRSCAARAGSWRRTAAGERLERLLEHGADAVVALDERGRPRRGLPHRRGRRPRRHDRHPLGRARAGRDPGRRPASPATSRSATSPGPTITLPAPALRSVSLDLRGFRVDLPPPEQRRQGFLDLTRHVAAGDIAVDARGDPARARSGRPGSASAAPRAARSSSWFLDHATADLEWCRAAEGEEPTLSEIEAGRPVVLRGGTVLTMNDAHDILHGRRRARGRRGDRRRRPGARGARGHAGDRRRPTAS